jgi:hypothetical protein
MRSQLAAEHGFALMEVAMASAVVGLSLINN